MSKIQVNEIVNHFDNGAPDCPKGLTITGVVTATTFSGNVETLNIDSVGIITAQSGVHFGLVGSGVTIDAVGVGTSLGFLVNGSERVRIDNSGRLSIGISSNSYTEALLQVNTTFGSCFVNRYSHLLLQNKNASTTNWWNIAPRDSGDLTIGNGAPGADGVITDQKLVIDNSGNFQFNSGYGSAATAYGCRAWVNFNGTGTVAIRESGNVSSITDLAVGTYRVNFTNAMPDSNYTVSGFSGRNSIPTVAGQGNVRGNSYVDISVGYNDSGVMTASDSDQVNVTIFR